MNASIAVPLPFCSPSARPPQDRAMRTATASRTAVTLLSSKCVCTVYLTALFELCAIMRLAPQSLEQLPKPKTMSRGQPRAGCGTDESNKLWVNLDGCGLFTAGITQGLQLFGAVVTHVRIFCRGKVTPMKHFPTLQTVVIQPWLGGTQVGLYLSAFFILLYILASTSHLRGAFWWPSTSSPSRILSCRSDVV